MPDSASVQAQWTVTSSLYHPALFAVRSGAALIVGAVLSILIVTTCGA